MRGESGFNVYPRALELLKNSGIVARVDMLKESEDGLPYFGTATFQHDIIDSVKYMKEKGYYNNIPKDFHDTYKTTMNAMLNNPETFFWSITKQDNTTLKEKCSIEDMLLFTGELASYVLDPQELWDYKKFGFDSPMGFISTVGAYLVFRAKNDEDMPSHFSRQGYVWTNLRNDGSEIVSEITGDHNADFMIRQFDKTIYPTTNPFGDVIFFRPTFSSDKNVVAAYHSNESAMLAITLRYIEQLDLKTTLLDNNASALKDYANSIAPGMRIDAGGSYMGLSSARMSFLPWGDDIPVLDANGVSNIRSQYGLSVQFEGWYRAYITQNNDLIISYDRESSINDLVSNPVQISAKFAPNDVDHLLKGLVYQCMKGLGRTSPGELFETLDYRFSKEFHEDTKR